MVLDRKKKGKEAGMRESEGSFSEICKNAYASVISFFVLCVLVVFPLYYRDYYFDILEAKYQFYYLSIILMMAAVLLLTIVFFVIDRLEWKGKHAKAFFQKFSRDRIRNTITCTDAFLLAFLILAVISTLQSDYVFEAFWGNEGRFTGLFLHLLYIFSFFIISRLYRFQRWHFQAFIIVAMLPLLFGITDYFNMDLLHFKEDISSDDWKNFTSTFGNINTYTTYVGVIFGCVSGLFTAERVRWKAGLYYGALVITAFAMIMGISDNGFLAFGIVFAALPFYALRSRQGTRRYLAILATFLSVLAVTARIDFAMKGDVLALEGVFLVLAGLPGLELLAAAGWAAVIISWLTEKRARDAGLKRGKAENGGSRRGVKAENDIPISGSEEYGRRRYGQAEDSRQIGTQAEHNAASGRGHSRRRRKKSRRLDPVRIWGIFLLLCVLAGLFLLYDANFGGHAERYGSLGRYLRFSDEWGTYRGLIWRITMEAYGKQPLRHKIFGYGLDTFGMMVMEYREETFRICGQVFDSAHNEYLQYFVTVGPLGFLSYMGFLAAALVRIVKNTPDFKYGLAILFGVLCYLAQGIVTINLPIVTPIMWMLLSVGAAAARRDPEDSGRQP